MFSSPPQKLRQLPYTTLKSTKLTQILNILYIINDVINIIESLYSSAGCFSTLVYNKEHLSITSERILV